MNEREPGNIDLGVRPSVRMSDDSIATVRSMSFQDDDGSEVLVPTISDDGRVMSNDEAIDQYRRTGKHLGKFDSVEGADAAAQRIHEQQADTHTKTEPSRGRGLPEIAVTGTREQKPKDRKVLVPGHYEMRGGKGGAVKTWIAPVYDEASWGDTLGAIPAQIGGQQQKRSAALEHRIYTEKASNARKQFLQARTLPRLYREWQEHNQSTLDERDRTNFTDYPGVIEAAKLAGVRPDVFTRDWPDFVNLSEDDRAKVKKDAMSRMERFGQKEKEAKGRIHSVNRALGAIRPDVDEWSAKGLAFDALTSAPDLALAAGVTAVAGPGAGAGSIFATTAPTAYADAIDQGATPSQADAYALLYGLAETAPETPVLEVLAKTPAGKKAMQRLLGQWADSTGARLAAAGGYEGLSESVTEALEIGIDAGILNQKTSLPEAFNRIARAGVIGTAVGAGVHGAGEGIEKIAERKKTSPQPKPSDANPSLSTTTEEAAGEPDEIQLDKVKATAKNYATPEEMTAAEALPEDERVAKLQEYVDRGIDYSRTVEKPAVAEETRARPDQEAIYEDTADQDVQRLAKTAKAYAKPEEIESALEKETPEARLAALQPLVDRGIDFGTKPAAEPLEAAVERRQEPRKEADVGTQSVKPTSAAGATETMVLALRAVRNRDANPEQVKLLEDKGLVIRNETNVPRLLPAGRRELAKAEGQAVETKVHGQEITVNVKPSDAQKDAGNYQKGHVKLFGLDLAIENPAGSRRPWKNPDTGESGERTMKYPYGYVKRTEGADGDAVDVYVGPNEKSKIVFVVNQLKKDGSFDEHKAMLGFNNIEHAKASYMRNFQPGWKGMGDVVEMTTEEFKHWTENGDTKAPIQPQPKRMQFSKTDLRATDVNKFSKDLEKELGLQHLDLYLTHAGHLHLSMIVVPKEKRKQGIGSKAMERISKYADEHGYEVTLTPAQRGDIDGTTSKSRLKKFYKRFGFVENKGRNKDFTTRESMRRRPKAKPIQFSKTRKISRAAALKKWFGKSKVVDSDGKPLVVFHGTVGDFDSFDQERGDPEADFGKGFYFSNTPEDVASNYAGIGPDLENKIERMAEQITAESERPYPHYGDPRRERRDAAARRLAMRRMGISDRGSTMAVYLKMENPAYVGGENDSFLDFESVVDEETGDFTGDEHGKLVDFILALRNVASRYDDGDIEDGISQLVNEGMDGGIKLSRAIELLKGSEQFGYFTDENGKLASSEIIREALEDSGFDGIIDFTVDVKFGSQRRLGKRMEGMNPDTVHYIVFKPEQIKSAIGNQGTFDPNDPSILKSVTPFYSAVERFIEKSSQKTATPDQWLGILKNAPGLKSEEMEWLGLDEFLRELPKDFNGGKISREAILEYIRANQIKVEEVVLGMPREGYSLLDAAKELFGDHVSSFHDLTGQQKLEARGLHDKRHASMSDGTAQYDRDTLKTPGGSNYRELLLTLPVQTDKTGWTAKEGPGDLASGPVWEVRDANGRWITGLPRADVPTAAGAIARAEHHKYGPAGYVSSHFSDRRNILTHVRFDERTDADGKKVLFIEEIQSDWHQTGRKRGYATPFSQEKFTAAEKRALDASHEMQAALDGAARALDRNDYLGFDSTSSALNAVRTNGDWMTRWDVNEEDRPPIQRYVDAYHEAKNAQEDVRRMGGIGVPDAPFKTTWHELALKRMIRWAAEHGFDRIAWTTGAMQADRYNLATHVRHVHALAGAKGRRVLIDMANGTSTSFDVDSNGNISSGQFIGNDLSAVIGDDLAARIMAVPKDRQQSFSGADLSVGGQGMKGFYDKILVQSANKLGKKFGAKVGSTNINAKYFDVFNNSGSLVGGAPTLERAQQILAQEFDDTGSVKQKGWDIVHSMDVTPQMREAALGGLPLFSRGPKGKGMHKDAVRTTVARVTQRYQTPNIVVVQSPGQLPFHLWQRLQNEGGDTSAIDGFYDGEKIYIIADNIIGEAHLVDTIYHELVVHYGLRQVMSPADLEELQDGIWRDMEKAVRDVANRNGLDVNDIDQRRLAAEEVMAYMAGKVIRGEKLSAPEKTLWEQIVAAVRRFFDALGISSYFDDAKLAQIILDSNTKLQSDPGAYADRLLQPAMIRSQKAPLWYSPMMREFEDPKLQAIATPDEWQKIIANKIATGKIREAEMKWYDLREWLANVTVRDLFEIDGYAPSSKEVTDEHAQAFRDMKSFNDLIAQMIAKTADTLDPVFKDLQQKREDMRNLLTDARPLKISKEAILAKLRKDQVLIKVKYPRPDSEDALPDDFEWNDPDGELHWDEDSAREYARESLDDNEVGQNAIENMEAEWDVAAGGYEFDADDFVNADQYQSYVAEKSADETAIPRMDHIKDESLLEIAKEGGYYKAAEDSWIEDRVESDRAHEESEGSRAFTGAWTDPSGKRWKFVADGGGSDGWNYISVDGEEIKPSLKYGIGQDQKSVLKDIFDHISKKMDGGIFIPHHDSWVMPIIKADYKEKVIVWENPRGMNETYNHYHWPDEDVLAHTRSYVVENSEGKKILVMDEFQSDWHQEVRDANADTGSAYKTIEEKSNHVFDMWKEMMAGGSHNAHEELLTHAADLLHKYGTQAEFATVVLSTRGSELSNIVRETMNIVGSGGDKERGVYLVNGPRIGDFSAEKQEAWIANYPGLYDKIISMARTRDVQAFEYIKEHGVVDAISSSHRVVATALQLIQALRKHLDTDKWQDLVNDGGAGSEIDQRFRTLLLDLGEDRNAIIKASEAVGKQQPVPPLSRTWPIALFQWGVREAAEQNLDGIAITSGSVHGVRWSATKSVKSASMFTHAEDLFDDDVSREAEYPSSYRIPNHFIIDDHPMVKSQLIKREVDPKDPLVVLQAREGDINLDSKKIYTTKSRLSGWIGKGAAAVLKERSDQSPGADSVVVSTTPGLAVWWPIGFGDTRAIKIHHGSMEIYNTILPNQLNDWLKKFKLRLGTSGYTMLRGPQKVAGAEPIPNATAADGYRFEMPTVMLTPEIKAEALEKGFPLLFSRKWYQRAKNIANRVVQGGTNFDVPDPSSRSRAWNYLVYKMQDKFVDLFKTQQEAAAWHQVTQLPDQLDAYLQQTLFHGRAEHQVKEHEKKFVEPLIRLIKQSGYEWEDAEDFLYARHAPEANAHLLRINNGNPQFNSGMTDAEAHQVMADLASRGDIRKLNVIGLHVDLMTKWSRDQMVMNGLEDASTIQEWENTYKNYVPLKGWKDQVADPDVANFLGMPKKGKGFDTGGKLTKQRTGRTSRAATILANIVAQAQATIILSEKAKVGRAFYDFVTSTPSSRLWSVDEVEYMKHVDPNTGLVRQGVNPQYKLADNVIRVKRNGKEYHITLNDEIPQMRRIAEAMKNLSADQIGPILSALHKVNRFLSAINTSLNPEFTVTNALRDVQTALINLNEEDRPFIKTKILSDWRKAWWAIRRGEQKSTWIAKNHTAQWAQEWEEFKKEGAKVGWIDHYSSAVELDQKLQKMMGPDGVISWTAHGIRRLGDFVENENLAVENALRLSTYVNLRNAGMSQQRAASYAKNLTVNFNRKGASGTFINSLYLFYNAAVQGTARMYIAAKNPRVRKVMYGIMAAAMARDILNRMLGGEDDDGEPLYDKIPEGEKERNMIFMLPNPYVTPAGEKISYLKIALPYGYNVIDYTGQKMGKLFDHSFIGNARRYNGPEEASLLVGSMVKAFSPLGDMQSSVGQFIAPTALDPLVQISENKAWHGGKLMPDDYPGQPPSPDSQKFFRSTPAAYREVAAYMNKISGGTEITPGNIDISPETMQLWAETAGGGLARFMTSAIDAPTKDPSERELRDVPFLRKVLGGIGDRQTRDLFMGHLVEIERARDEIDAVYEMGIQTPEGQERLAYIQKTYPIASKMIRDAYPNFGESRSDDDRGRRAVQRALKESITPAKPISADPARLRGRRRAITTDLKEARREIARLEARTGLPDKERKEKIAEQKKKIHDLMIEFNKQWNAIEDSVYGERNSGKLLERLGPMINGKSRKEAASALREGGLNETANLLSTMPPTPDRFALEFFRLEAAREQS